ncbi:MAG: gluconate 5-dehydrogenase [Tannerella sp.]|jgi:gluconate 5-dehydrogenase|nr:gluconate 5-dehydrogenase [Tannerella sp.]
MIMESILEKFGLNDKIALVTGGTSGLGFNMAVALGQAGARICVNDIRDEKLEEAKKSFGQFGLDVFTVNFDVSREEEVDKGITAIEKEVGEINILINNAGIIKRIPILDMAVSDFKQVLDVNLVSSLIVSKRVVPGMIGNGGGKIINICSMMSEQGRNSVSAYASAKGGLKMLTKSMCSEWAKHNIQVNGIGPGYIKTILTTDFVKKDHPFNKLVMMRTPANRWGEPDDLMGAAVFLASAASDFINGQVIYVDGGILANFGYMENEND